MAGGRDDGIVHRHLPSTSIGARLHIVIIAWLFVTLTMALAMRSGWGGAAFFLVVGIGPVALVAWLALRRAGPHPPPASAFEGQVKPADDRDA